MAFNKNIFIIICCLCVLFGCKKDKPQSSAKAITSFKFSPTVNVNWSADVYGVIKNDSIIISLSQGTVVANLIPTIVFTGKTISPSVNAAQNFSNPVTYTVTADDGSIAQYKVVVVFLSTQKLITSFVLKAAQNAGLTADINGTIGTDTISLHIPVGFDLTKLTPIITYIGSSITPNSLTSTNFSSPVQYTVTAQDGSTKTYTVIASYNAMVYIAGSDGYLYALDAATGAITWKFNDDGQMANPAYADNTIFVGDSKGQFYAFNAATGTVKWNVSLSTAGYSMATVHDGKVIAVLDNGGNKIIALDENSGKLLWESAAVGFSASVPNAVSQVAPIVENGFVIVATYWEGPFAYNENTGQLIWSVIGEKATECQPAYSNGAVYNGTEGNVATAYDATTGAIKWTQGRPTYNGQLAYWFNNYSSPTVSGNTVYTGGSIFYYNNIGSTTAVGHMFAINSADGSVIWKYAGIDEGVGSGTFGCPVVLNNVLYCGDNIGHLYALDASTGVLNWSKRISNIPQNVSYPTHPVIANGQLFVVEYDNMLHMLSAANGNKLWSFLGSKSINTLPCVVDANGNVFYSSFSGDVN